MPTGRIFVDFHHASLLRSFVMLFEDRLGYEIARPVGMEWFGAGFWAINDQIDTAKQYLDLESQQVADGTPPLNEWGAKLPDGTYMVLDPGRATAHRAIRLDAFKDMKFDYVVASIPAHIPLFKRLIHSYQPDAKLIVHVGNNWPAKPLEGLNVLASVREGMYPLSNTVYHRQEFDTNIFCPPDAPPATQRISSYVNCLQEWTVGWGDFTYLESQLKEYGVPMFSFGGQCRDGNFAGPHALAGSMQQDSMIFHVKDYGDGYGHIVHNAFACGVPVIHRGRFTKGTLIADLLNENNSIDLDEHTAQEGVDEIVAVLDDKYALQSMREQTVKAFVRNVDFEADAKRVGAWLETL